MLRWRRGARAGAAGGLLIRGVSAASTCLRRRRLRQLEGFDVRNHESRASLCDRCSAVQPLQQLGTCVEPFGHRFERVLVVEPFELRLRH